jgi:proteasome assembly chaperone (PAC2) family protein
MEHVEFAELPQLENALLIAAFGGWNDAASAGTWAIEFLSNQWDTVEFAEMDAEPFYDFTETRPHVRVSNGTVRRVTWPEITFAYGKAPRTGADLPARDVVLFHGDEPQLKWKTFTRTLVEVCKRCNVTEVALLGALVGEVPHTTPVQIFGTSSEQATLRRMERRGVGRANYEGPTGILTIIHDAVRRAGMSASSLWGTAPHYVSASPNLPVAEALLEKLAAIYRLDLNLGDLDQAARRFTAKVSSLVASDPEVSAYVRELEERSPSESAASGMRIAGEGTSLRGGRAGGELPSAEEAIRDVEDWLRQFRSDAGSES